MTEDVCVLWGGRPRQCPAYTAGFIHSLGSYDAELHLRGISQACQ